MAEDYLSKVFKSAYSDVICKWRSDGLTDTEIIDRLNKNTVNNSMNALLKQAAKDYYEYFVEKRFEISYSQKIESDKFIAHQNEIWGKCFVVS